jgi:hypothetical protein
MIRTVRGAIIKFCREVPPYQVIVSWARAGCRTALLKTVSYRSDNVAHWSFLFPFLTHWHGWPAAELVAVTVSLLGMFVTLSRCRKPKAGAWNKSRAKTCMIPELALVIFGSLLVDFVFFPSIHHYPFGSSA